MTNVPQSPDQTPPQLDNLAKLHRMSRTAGLATTDYAAVNVAAVMTLILGGASFLAIVSPIFLVIAVAGMVVGVIALSQVLGSNRTQTGLAVAILGLLLCVAFSGMSGYKLFAAQKRDAQDKQELTALAEEFGKHLAAQDYAKAYALFDPRLKDRVPQKQLEQFFTAQVNRQFGGVKSMKPNGIFSIDESPDDVGARLAQGIAILETEKAPGQPMRPTIVYRYVGDQWRIFNIPEFFPAASNDPSGPPIPVGPMGPMLPGAPPAQPQ